MEDWNQTAGQNQPEAQESQPDAEEEMLSEGQMLSGEQQGEAMIREEAMIQEEATPAEETVSAEDTAVSEETEIPQDMAVPEETAAAPEAAVSEDGTPAGQSAVGLHELQDAETTIFVNEAGKMLDMLDEAQKDKSRLSKEVKQCEKNYNGMEKSVADGIAAALKKKKEEIAATYDKELSQYQDQIESCKMERAKAKANAIAQRIQIETAPLNQQNQELEAQIDMKYRDNKVPAICKKRSVSVLFFPKQLQDWIADIAVGVVLLFLIPLFFALTIGQNPLLLAFVLFVYTGLLFSAYLYVLHRYMLKFSAINEEVEELRKTIRGNNKTKQSTANRIKKSQDETGYNLGSFDDRIAEIQKIMQDTVAKRQEALENFENEIRHQITADITAANKEELQSLQQQFEQTRQELKNKTDEIGRLETEIKEKYESVFGKDLLYKQKLGGLAAFCQENPDLTIEQAVAQYKSQKK